MTLLREFIKNVLNESDEMNKERSFFVKILRKYVNADAFTKTPSIPDHNSVFDHKVVTNERNKISNHVMYNSFLYNVQSFYKDRTCS